MNLRNVFFSIVLLLGFGPVAQAATFCATSGNELNIALNEAGHNGQDDDVRVAVGTHISDYHFPTNHQWSLRNTSLDELDTDVTISGGWNGADNCQTQITQDPSQTVLDARYWGPVFLFLATNSVPGWVYSGTFTIRNMTFNRGKGNYVGHTTGLAIFDPLSATGSIVVDNVHVVNGQSAFQYAAALNINLGGSGSIRLRNSIVSNNNFTGPDSRPVFLGPFDSVIAYVSNNSVFGNSVTSAAAGMHVWNIANLTNNAIADNVSTANPHYQFFSDAPTQMSLTKNHFGTAGFFNGSPFSETGTTTGDPAWSAVGVRRVPDAVSPLRDSGDNAPLGQVPNIDFSGSPRIINVTIDRGAVEADAPPASEVGPVISAVSPADGSTTVFEGPIGGGFVGTQLTFNVSGGIAPGVTELECSKTPESSPGFGIGSIGETVGVGGSITPIDVGFDNITSELQTGTITCAVIRELAGTSYLTFNFVAAPPGGPAVIATSPQPAPDPSHVIDLTAAFPAVQGSDVVPKSLKIFNIADFGSSDLEIDCFPSGGSDPQILITPMLVDPVKISPQGALEVSFDCDTSAPGSYSADYSCGYDLDDSTNPWTVDGEIEFRAECDVRPEPSGPVYGSSPTDDEEMNLGTVIQNETDPFLDLQIINYGAAESTLSGSCSITAGGGTFSIDGDNAFSLGQNEGDTVRVICDSAQALQHHIGELQCEHNGEAPGEDSPAVYQLDCDITPPPASDVIPSPASGTTFEAVLDPGGTFAFDVDFPEVKNEGVDASLVSCSLDDGSVFAITSPVSFPQVIASGTTVTVSVEGTAPGGATTITDTLRCTYTDTDSDNVEVVYPINVIVEGNATFAVTKDFTDNNPAEVTVRLDCNTGLILDQDKVISEADGDPAVVFVVTDFDGGELNCTITEDSVPGYVTTYEASGDSGNPDDDSCVFTAVAAGDENACLVTNTPAAVDVVINKEWVFEGSTTAIDTRYELTLYCSSEIVNGNEKGAEVPAGPAPSCGFYALAESPTTINSQWCKTFHGDEPASFTAKVIPEYPSSDCHVEERVYDDAIEIENGCNDITISAGNGDECTITNTVFFEGIPTLGSRGLVVLALLMLGLGLVGIRRIV